MAKPGIGHKFNSPNKIEQKVETETLVRSYKLKTFETKSKKEMARYLTYWAKLNFNYYLSRQIFTNRKNESTRGKGWLANQMQHQASGKSRAILASAKETGNKYNIPFDPIVEVPANLYRSEKSKHFDFFLEIFDGSKKSGTISIPVKSHKALNAKLKSGWKISTQANLKNISGENFVIVYVSKVVEIKTKPMGKKEFLGVDVGYNLSYVDSDGNAGIGCKTINEKQNKKLSNQRKTSARYLNSLSKSKRDEKKKEIKVVARKLKSKNKTIIKQKLDIQAKDLIRRANQAGRCLVFENPVTIGNISRGNLQGWAGAYLARRCQILGAEFGIRIIFVHAAGTSNTCSGCGLKDGTKRVKRDLWACECDSILHADHNAARNIALRGMRKLGIISSNSGRNNKLNQPRKG